MTGEKKSFLRSFGNDRGKGKRETILGQSGGESNDDIGKCVNEIMTNEIMNILEVGIKNILL